MTTQIEQLIRKRTEQYKLDLPEQDMCSKTNLIWLFIQDLQSLQEPTEQQWADVEEIKWCPKCWNKIKRDYDDEYCCECWVKLN